MNAKEKIRKFNKECLFGNERDVMLVELMRKNGLNDETIAGAIDAMEKTCPHCHDAPRGCQCWNDD